MCRRTGIRPIRRIGERTTCRDGETDRFLPPPPLPLRRLVKSAGDLSRVCLSPPFSQLGPFPRPAFPILMDWISRAQRPLWLAVFSSVLARTRPLNKSSWSHSRLLVTRHRRRAVTRFTRGTINRHGIKTLTGEPSRTYDDTVAYERHGTEERVERDDETRIGTRTRTREVTRIDSSRL